MPALTMIAGANGSGKSTITRYLDFEGKTCLLDPDAIARRMNPADPRLAAVSAGREAIRRTREYITSGVSFAIETTLSGSGMADTMRQGGHDVPVLDIRRRYERSLEMLPGSLRVAHEGSVFENANEDPRLVLQTRDGEVTLQAPDAPAWVTRAISGLTAN